MGSLQRRIHYSIRISPRDPEDVRDHVLNHLDDSCDEEGYSNSTEGVLGTLASECEQLESDAYSAMSLEGEAQAVAIEKISEKLAWLNGLANEASQRLKARE